MQRTRLVDLPNDVLQLIIQALLAGSSITPRYSDEDLGYSGDLRNFTAKCKEYYGEQNDGNDQCTMGFLSWSSSSTYFRTLLAPYLYKSVVLRDTPKSVASIKFLSETRHWKNVETFIFASTHKPEPTESESNGTSEDEGGNKIAKDLSGVLSYLPPYLQTLVIDVPCSEEEYWDEAVSDSFPDDSDSETSPYRLMLRNVLSSVISNDFSTKSFFELKLHNIIPYYCLVYDDDQWKKFLGNVTSFTIGFSHYDDAAGWNMNTVISAREFAGKLGSYFLNHLDRVSSFSFQCDDSWPLGTPEPLCYPTELPLPATRVWNGLKHVSFRETFLCTRMVEFLVAHLDTIKTIELVDCFAPHVDFDDSNDCVSWNALFTALSDARPSQLTQVEIEYLSRSEADLLDGYNQAEEETKRKEEVKQILRGQEKEIDEVGDEIDKTSKCQRQRKVFAYCSVDDRYGMIFDGEEMNVSRFLGLEDHWAWVKLVNVMESNQKAVGDRAR